MDVHRKFTPRAEKLPPAAPKDAHTEWPVLTLDSAISEMEAATTTKDLKAIYHQAALIFHPDKSNLDSKTAKENFQAIGDAYERRLAALKAATELSATGPRR